jgi:BlaI family transcriptional regulator, penicillinase repressor
MEINSNVDRAGSRGSRHSILDLAPLELECMTVLWPLGAGTVREIHHRLALSRPRAYTTVLTIMDRLAQKGIVTRRKVGRAYCYEPRLSVEEARLNAVGKIVEGFFDGSPQALAAHLSSQGGAAHQTVASAPASGVPVPVGYSEPPRGTRQRDLPAPPVHPESRRVQPEPRRRTAKVDAPGTSATESQTQNLDETLL